MNSADSLYINRLRGASILRVVLGHLGLGWILLPYSSYIGIFLSVLFFCSGYIFFYLFVKSPSVSAYIFRRILGVAIPFYLVYFFALAISAFISPDLPKLTLYNIFQIFIIAPNISDMPYPLGQIWYLRVLVFCTFVSPFFFYLGRRYKYFLLLPVVIAIVFAAIQTNYKFHKGFFFFGHNLFQEIVYGAYFFIGAFVYNCQWRTQKLVNIAIILICLIVSFGALKFWDLNLNLTQYAYAPNLFYFPLGIVGILLALLVVSPLERLINGVVYLAKLLDFCSKHSYGIYLNHSFFIVFYEYVFGLKGVMGDPLMATVKILLVIASSLLFAIPITYFSHMFLRLIRDQRKNKIM